MDNAGTNRENKKWKYVSWVLVIILVTLIAQLATHIFNGVINIISPIFNPVLNALNLGKPYVDVIVVNQKYFGSSHIVYLLNSGNNTAHNINFDINLPNSSVKILSITNVSANFVPNSPFVSSPFVHSLNYTQIGISTLNKNENFSFDVILNMPANITINSPQVNNNQNQSCVSYLDQDITSVNYTQESAAYELSFVNLGHCNIARQFAIPFRIGNITKGNITTPLITTITFNGFKPDTGENMYVYLVKYQNETAG